MNEIKKKLKLLREQEINEIKNETKRKLNMLDDKINDILEKLKYDFLKKPYEYDSSKKERESRILTKERINEIKRSKEEVKTMRINY